MCLPRVFRNLVDNAIKYGGRELNRISIGYEGSAEFQTFSVTDNGVGIKQEDCEKMFGLFHRNKSATGSEVQGLDWPSFRKSPKNIAARPGLSRARAEEQLFISRSQRFYDHGLRGNKPRNKRGQAETQGRMED